MKLVVFGDVIEDEDIYVKQAGFCPVHGVPKYKEQSRALWPGGAGNSAKLLADLGADVTLKAVGNPNSRLARALARVKTKWITGEFAVRSRYFYVHDNKPLCRMDVDPPQAEVGVSVPLHTETADGVLISDYSLTNSVPWLMHHTWQGPVVLNVKDPLSPRWKNLPQRAVLVCNRPDANAAAVKGCGMAYLSDKEILSFLVTETGRTVVITNSDAAVWYGGRDLPPVSVPVPRVSQDPQSVGAGDMFSAGLLWWLAEGFSLPLAVPAAIGAAVAYVSRPRGVPVTITEWMDSKTRYTRAMQDRRTMPGFSVNDKVVFTNGCFDLLHPGHRRLLSSCVTVPGQVLVVAVNSDQSVRELKGSLRPYRPLEYRLLDVAYAIDPEVEAYVVPFDGDVERFLQVNGLCPDVLVKGSEYEGKSIPGANLAGSVRFCPQLEGWSTTSLGECEGKHG